MAISAISSRIKMVQKWKLVYSVSTIGYNKQLAIDRTSYDKAQLAIDSYGVKGKIGLLNKYKKTRFLGN